MKNTISFTQYILEDYKRGMYDLVEAFYEYYEVNKLSDAIEMFENEMYLDNNLADKYKFSDEDMATLRQIQIDILDYVEDVFMATHIPQEILVEFKAEFDHDDDEFYEILFEFEGDDEGDWS